MKITTTAYGSSKPRAAMEGTWTFEILDRVSLRTVNIELIGTYKSAVESLPLVLMERGIDPDKAQASLQPVDRPTRPGRKQRWA